MAEAAPSPRLVRLSMLAMLAFGPCMVGIFPAHAGQRATSDLAATLDRLARERHVELLYDERLLVGKRPGHAPKAATTEQALAQILLGSGLTFRKSPSGVFVIVAGTSGGGQPVGNIAHAPPAPLIPDILVTARRSLDADIRRTEDDPQPYRTVGREVIEDSQPATLDDFLKTRLPQDAQILSLHQAPFSAGGSVRSQIDLRGLGPAQTLVLVNGRRLASVPGLGELLQPDISALPVNGIDRIETLASSAGGIFGIGAGGGAVNLVTRSDYKDVTLVLNSAISQLGDGAQRLVDAHLGVTSKGGHTQISVRYTRRQDDGLTFGSRRFVEDSRILRYQRVGGQNYLPVSASINIISATPSNLTLVPMLGGQSLGATTTYLPVPAAPLASSDVSALLANAGRFDLTMAPDGQGSEQSLLTPTQTNAVMATIRQTVGERLVLYVDYLRLLSIGRAVIGGVQSTTSLAPGQQGNPFAQPIQITFPTAGLLGEVRTRTLTDRLTLGAILHLGGGWVANLDAATGQAVADQTENYTPISLYGINVFQGGSSLAEQLSRIAATPFYRNHASNRLRDLNLRIAGPVATLPAGPVSVSVTGELRDEHAPGAIYDNYVSTPAQAFSTIYQSARQRVGSLFAEARIPIFAGEGPLSPWRGLEMQFAVRGDHYEIAAPITDPQLLQLGTFGTQAVARSTVVAVTASMRVEPLDGLVFRGSYADGYTPPTQAQISPSGFSFGFFPYSDPKRPGDGIFSSVQTLFLYGGLPGQHAQHSRSWSFGTIVKPAIIPGLRLSADLSVLKTDHELTDFAMAQFQYFVTNEALYPGRITRAALTPVDIAAGYTAGRITQVNATYLSTGSSVLTAVDVALDFNRDTSMGRVHIYGQGTWEPTLRRGAADAGSYNLVDALNGPVSLRASGGIALTRGAWSFGVDAQVYGAYRVTFAYQPGSVAGMSYVLANQTNLLEQGSAKIPAQAYVDAWTSLVTGGASSGLKRPTLRYRLGIRNLLNKAPPIVVPPLSAAFDGIGYSPLGDPRGRIFEAEATIRF